MYKGLNIALSLTFMRCMISLSLSLPCVSIVFHTYPSVVTFVISFSSDPVKHMGPVFEIWIDMAKLLYKTLISLYSHHPCVKIPNLLSLLKHITHF